MWLLIIYIFVNGHWATADYLIEDWQPSAYETEEECNSTRDTARHIEARLQLKESPGSIIPRRFECEQR